MLDPLMKEELIEYERIFEDVQALPSMPQTYDELQSVLRQEGIEVGSYVSRSWGKET